MAYEDEIESLGAFTIPDLWVKSAFTHNGDESLTKTWKGLGKSLN
jgi:hypothetical protein